MARMRSSFRLTRTQEAAVTGLQRARMNLMRLEIKSLSARSRIRVAQAMREGLQGSERTHRRMRSYLAGQESSGYSRLGHLATLSRLAQRQVLRRARDARALISE